MLLLFSAELKMKYFFKILLFSSDCDIRGTGADSHRPPGGTASAPHAAAGRRQHSCPGPPGLLFIFVTTRIAPRFTLPQSSPHSHYRFVYPIRDKSTSLAQSRPSRMAHTTRDWPRCMSPAVKTLSTLVL